MAKSKPRSGQGPRRVRPVDLHVGTRVRQRRVLLGMTQTDLANTVGLTFQQVQKYEKGTNRISASRLYGLSQLFGVTVEYFFEDMPPDVVSISPAKGRGKVKTLPRYEPDPMLKRETLELVRAYYEIENADIRKQVYELTKSLGAAGVQLRAKRLAFPQSIKAIGPAP